MSGRRDLKDFSEIDRLAQARAGTRCTRPTVEPVPAAVVTAIGVYLLLTILAVLVQVDLAPGQFSRIGLALVAAAAAYLERRYRQRKWQQAYRNAFGEIKAERKGTDESGS